MKSYREEQRKAILKDRGIIYRHPKLFVWSLTILGLGVFFSKPIYDLVFRDKREYAVEFAELRRTHKSRFEKD